MHTAVLNTDPDSCPPEVKPRPHEKQSIQKQTCGLPATIGYRDGQSDHLHLTVSSLHHR